MDLQARRRPESGRERGQSEELGRARRCGGLARVHPDGGVFSAVFEPLCFPVIRTPGYADPGWAAKACAVIERDGLGVVVVPGGEADLVGLLLG